MKCFKSALVSVFAVSLSACGSQTADTSATKGSGSYPTHPDLTTTPGAVCQDADETRYPEHIKYCTRDVNSGLKRDIIAQYDRDFGFTIEAMPRADFKIDHFIPLCMGGANERSNLWPQHKSVYVLTDGIEMKLCQLMAGGNLKQAEAIEDIKRIKFNLNEAPAFEKSLDQRIGSGH